METMLTKIADFYDEEVDAAVEALTAMLEPLMMVFLGGTVGGMLDRDVPADLQDRRHDRLTAGAAGPEPAQAAQAIRRPRATSAARAPGRAASRLVLMAARLALALVQPRDRAHARRDRARATRCDAVAGLLRHRRLRLRRDARLPAFVAADRSGSALRGDQRRHRPRASSRRSCCFSGGDDSVFTLPVRAGRRLRRAAVPGRRGALASRGARASFAYAGVLLAADTRLARRRLGSARLGRAAGAGDLGRARRRGAAAWRCSRACSRASCMRTGEALAERTQDLARLRTLHQRTVESLMSGLLTTDLRRPHHLVQPGGASASPAVARARGARPRPRAGAAGRPRAARSRAPATASPARARACRTRSPAGEQLHLGVGAYVLRDASGDACGHVVIFQDVTEVVAMERELRRSERLAAIGELSASIAHEIRNPLAAISGSIQVLQRAAPARRRPRGAPADGDRAARDRSAERADHRLPARSRGPRRAADRAVRARRAGGRGARDVRGVAPGAGRRWRCELRRRASASTPTRGSSARCSGTCS